MGAQEIWSELEEDADQEGYDATEDEVFDDDEDDDDDELPNGFVLPTSDEL